MTPHDEQGRRRTMIMTIVNDDLLQVEDTSSISFQWSCLSSEWGGGVPILVAGGWQKKNETRPSQASIERQREKRCPWPRRSCSRIGRVRIR